MNLVTVKGRVLLNGQPLQAKGVKVNFLGIGPSLFTGNTNNSKVDETGVLRLLQVGVGASPDYERAEVWAKSFRKQTLQWPDTVQDVRASVPPNKARGLEIPAGVYKFGIDGYTKPFGCFRVTY